MEFYLPFDESYYIKKNKLRWRLANKKKMRSSLILFCLGVIGILLSYRSSPHIDWSNLFSDVLFSIFITNLFINYLNYRKGQSLINQNARWKKELSVKSNETANWEFEEEYFRYRDSDIEYKLSWRSMRGYILHPHYLFILSSWELVDAITISEEQIGSEKFDKIVELAKRKLRPSV
jgi:hypothetical protein